jgi:hypothetical protein
MLQPLSPYRDDKNQHTATSNQPVRPDSMTVIKFCKTLRNTRNGSSRDQAIVGDERRCRYARGLGGDARCPRCSQIKRKPMASKHGIPAHIESEIRTCDVRCVYCDKVMMPATNAAPPSSLAAILTVSPRMSSHSTRISPRLIHRLIRPCLTRGDAQLLLDVVHDRFR